MLKLSWISPADQNYLGSVQVTPVDKEVPNYEC